jgi:glutaconate CoA-transferase, subunit B
MRGWRAPRRGSRSGWRARCFRRRPPHEPHRRGTAGGFDRTPDPRSRRATRAAHRGGRRLAHPGRRLLAGGQAGHKRSGNPFTEGTRELFDLTGQGRIDLFFLGGGEIDGEANLNLIGTGEWPGTAVRFPGSFGSAFMYMMAGRTILFREEHSPRVLVPRVAHVSAPGVSAPGVFRRGHAQALVTGRGVFRFHPERARFSLASVHPGETVASIREATGFAFDAGDDVPQTTAPTDTELALLRGAVCDEMLETYPEFCARVFGRRNAA